ncbi:MAG TPA: penicillin-binding protein activator [Deltaproteobacteria bacterium]|nr:penicillin-binding protein activator [Deltaproteobacteria bacterium]HQI82065.1 penicillin-binding protein activator [Deltaproteobacteria bacterium]
MKESPIRASATLCAAALALILCTGAAPMPAAVSPFDHQATVSTPAVGVLLPLSGRWESVGQRILNGISAAGGVFAAGPVANVQYVIMDYGSREDSIPALIESLDRDHRVTALIGPVGERACEIACAEVQARSIPALVFTQAELRPREGACCFGVFLTVEMQARALLGAARAMGVTRFGVLSPDDQFGRTFSEHFGRLAPSFGVQVVRTRVYAPSRVDFRQELEALFPGRKMAAARGDAVEALLIPDSAQNAALAASYLTFLRIKARLFGPTLWDSPEFVRVGGRHVEDAVFLSGFHQDSLLTPVQDFGRAFSSTFRAPPTVWEASAYDAARIVQGYLDEHGPSRPGVKGYVAGLKNYPGASGILSFSPAGTVTRTVHVLTVKDGLVHEIRP